MKRHDPFKHDLFENDSFYDEWQKDFKTNMRRGFGILTTVVIANLVVWAVVIWAIIKVVNYYT